MASNEADNEIVEIGVPGDATPALGDLVHHNGHWYEVVGYGPRNTLRLMRATVHVVVVSGRIGRDHSTKRLAGGWVSVERADQQGGGFTTVVIPVHDIDYVQWLEQAMADSTQIPVTDDFFERGDDARQRVFEQVVRLLMRMNGGGKAE